MLSQKVQNICQKHGYIHCDKCPLNEICKIDHHKLPGTIEGKVALWEKIMNFVANEVTTAEPVPEQFR